MIRHKSPLYGFSVAVGRKKPGTKTTWSPLWSFWRHRILVGIRFYPYRVRLTASLKTDVGKRA